MSTPEPVTVKPAPAFDLDFERLGAILVRLAAASANLGHASLKATLWYGSTEGCPEAEFINDVIKLPTAAVVEKWYGGQGNASRYVNELVSRQIAKAKSAARGRVAAR
jgi:hypothetical protein